MCVIAARVDGAAYLVPNPIIVFEVVSETAARLDLVEKRDDYQQIPTILRYIVVERTRIAATVFERAAGGDPWTERTLGPGDLVRIPEAGIEFPLAAVYEDVDLPP